MNSPRPLPPIALEDLAPPRRRLVAVLPFTSAGPDESLHLLGRTVADLLHDSLLNTPELNAIVISSDFLSRAPEHALELICRQLRVGYLISGHCHGVGTKTSLYIELADTRHWHIAWADFFQGNARDLLDPEGQAMARVVSGLRQALRHQPRLLYGSLTL